jgi:cell volume regulation protein A
LTSLDSWRRRDPVRATGSPARGDPFRPLESSEQNGAGYQRVHAQMCWEGLGSGGIAVRVFPSLSPPAEQLVERVVTVALLCILFDGGMHLGWPRSCRSAAPIAGAGYRGHVPDRSGRRCARSPGLRAGLVSGGPAGDRGVADGSRCGVFRAGRREVAGRSGDILEGESGANDPVGIALMVALLAAGSIDPAAFPAVAGQFVLQLGVGVVVGVAGGRALLWFIRRVGAAGGGAVSAAHAGQCFRDLRRRDAGARLGILGGVHRRDRAGR